MGTRRRPAPVQQRTIHEPPTGSTDSSINTNSTSMARPPPIQTRPPSAAAAAIAASGTSQRNEVVIDGESSATDSEEEDVMVITPQSRKRNRTSAIMDEDDDDDDEGEEAKQGDEADGGNARNTPLATKRLYLSPELRDATTARQSAARAGGIINSNEDIDVDVDDVDDDDDEVEIVQVGSAAKPLDGSASKKNRRLTIEDSDDESEQASQERIAAPALNTSRFENTPNRRRSSVGTNGGTPSPGITPGSNASSSRRSSRIERKRQEKESESSSARKLNYLSLDNCLDPIENLMKKGKNARADGTDEDDEDDDDDFEVEEEEKEVATPGKRRPQRRETEREVLHADGDDDLDEFIVGDNEIEYMDDDENGVISVESGSEEDDIEEYNEADEFAAHRAAQQTRERDEWFAIYMEYIEESIIDADLDNKMRRRQGSPQYQLYREAIFHIERELCSRRDNLRGNVVWPEDMLDALKTASSFRSSHCDADYECEACNRTNHMATYVAQLGGVACDASELYRENWMQRLRKNMFQAKTVNVTFQMGSVCHARTLAYWQLLHAKRFWCILVDAKRKECSDATGRIATHFRTAFNKHEFGRYKRLLTLVETFETEARQSHATMSNVWKKITPQQIKSDFLPRHKGGSGGQQLSRRGTMDSFVAESENDEDEEVDDDVEHVEENEVVDADDDDDDDEEPEVEQKDENVHMGGPSRRAQEDKSSTSKITAFFTATSTNKPETLKSEHETSNNNGKSANPHEGTEVEDLLCLVCGENPRNGGIMHGQYLHFYCCFRCGKRQFRAKMGCLVCDRPIDKVLRLLPLTAEARKAIKENK